MPVKDPLKGRIPYGEKIYFPYQLFRFLPVRDADKLQDEIQQLYFEQNPGEKRRIIERAKGNPDLVDTYQDEMVNKLVMTDYAYDAAILTKRRDDLVAQRLVEALNEYNLKVERQQATRTPTPTPAAETPAESAPKVEVETGEE